MVAHFGKLLEGKEVAFPFSVLAGDGSLDILHDRRQAELLDVVPYVRLVRIIEPCGA